MGTVQGVGTMLSVSGLYKVYDSLGRDCKTVVYVFDVSLIDPWRSVIRIDPVLAVHLSYRVVSGADINPATAMLVFVPYLPVRSVMFRITPTWSRGLYPRRGRRIEGWLQGDDIRRLVV